MSNTQFVIVAALAVVVIWAIVGVVPLILFGWPSDASEFADAFSMANSLFSCLAFAGVVVAVYLQHIALVATQRDLNQQGNAMFLAAYLSSLESHRLAALNREKDGCSLLERCRGRIEADRAAMMVERLFRESEQIVRKFVFVGGCEKGSEQWVREVLLKCVRSLYESTRLGFDDGVSIKNMKTGCLAGIERDLRGLSPYLNEYEFLQRELDAWLEKYGLAIAQQNPEDFWEELLECYSLLEKLLGRSVGVAGTPGEDQ